MFCSHIWLSLALAVPALGAEPSGQLWAALKHATGLSDTEVSHLADELLALRPPSQRGVWQAKVHCSHGTCAPEATSRLIAALGEAGKLPSRVFELFPGDPLYDFWKESDRQRFHSWVDGEPAGQETIEALMPEGQPLASGRIQAGHFTWQARKLVSKLLGPAVETHGALGRCLEWDTPFYTIKAFGHLCFRHDVLQYADPRAGLPEKMQTYQKGTRPGLQHLPLDMRSSSSSCAQGHCAGRLEPTGLDAWGLWPGRGPKTGAATKRNSSTVTTANATALNVEVKETSWHSLRQANVYVFLSHPFAQHAALVPSWRPPYTRRPLIPRHRAECDQPRSLGSKTTLVDGTPCARKCTATRVQPPWEILTV